MKHTFAGLFVTTVALFLLVGCTGPDDVRASVVRVVTRTGERSDIGTGFFVRDENGRHWVVTNFHVVDSGGDISVERVVAGKNDDVYLEAYPEVRVAHFDAAVDLAILELRNVPTEKMPPLELGSPKQDLRISSWGFPTSTLVVGGGLGLTRKEGTISNLVRFPVIDRTTGDVVQEDAVPAIVVSANLEPGFSGGPTVDDSGAVVGINVLKDSQHRGQDGAIHVDALRNLLRGLEPGGEPSPSEILGLLDSIQSAYLHLPLSQRATKEEVSFVELTDRPRLREFFAAVEYARNQTARQGNAPSAAAAIGHALSSLPGVEFASWSDRNTRVEAGRCVSRVNQLEDFLATSAAAAMRDDCLAKVHRLFVWDLVSSTVQWNGKPAAYTVTEVETLSKEKRLFKAMVSIDGAAGFPLLVSTESGGLHLKLFDQSGKAYAVQTPYAHETADFIGSWTSTRRFTTDESSDFQVSESVQIRGVGEGALEILHVFQRVGTAAPGMHWRCSGNKTYHGWMRQYFTGSVANGQIVPEKRRNAETSTDCPANYTVDELVRFELHRGELIMTRTDGLQWPEVVTFRKTQAGTN